MKILNHFMIKKSREFHVTILGDSFKECSEFYYKTYSLPSINTNTIVFSVCANKEGKFEGSIICKSSNHKKFKIELEKLIGECEKSED